MRLPTGEVNSVEEEAHSFAHNGDSDVVEGKRLSLTRTKMDIACETKGDKQSTGCTKSEGKALTTQIKEGGKG